MRTVVLGVCGLALMGACFRSAPKGNDQEQAPPAPSTSAQTTPPQTTSPATTSAEAASGALALSDMPLNPRDHQVVALPKDTDPKVLNALATALRESEALQACAARHPEAFHGQGGAAVLTFVALHPRLVRGPSLQHYMVAPPELRRPNASEALEQCARGPLEDVAARVTLPASGLVVGYIWRPLRDPSAPREPEGGLPR